MEHFTLITWRSPDAFINDIWRGRGERERGGRKRPFCLQLFHTIYQPKCQTWAQEWSQVVLGSSPIRSAHKLINCIWNEANSVTYFYFYAHTYLSLTGYWYMQRKSNLRNRGREREREREERKRGWDCGFWLKTNKKSHFVDDYLQNKLPFERAHYQPLPPPLPERKNTPCPIVD